MAHFHGRAHHQAPVTPLFPLGLMPHSGPRSACRAPTPGLTPARGWETLRNTYAWISFISPQRLLYLTISRSQKSSAARGIDFWNNFRQSQTWFMMMHIIDHLRRYLAIQNKKLCSHYVDGVRRQAREGRGEGVGGGFIVHSTLPEK